MKRAIIYLSFLLCTVIFLTNCQLEPSYEEQQEQKITTILSYIESNRQNDEKIILIKNLFAENVKLQIQDQKILDLINYYGSNKSISIKKMAQYAQTSYNSFKTVKTISTPYEVTVTGDIFQFVITTTFKNDYNKSDIGIKNLSVIKKSENSDSEKVYWGPANDEIINVGINY